MKNIKRISRVESLRNLFQRGDKPFCNGDSQNTSDIVNNNHCDELSKNEQLHNLYQFCSVVKEKDSCILNRHSQGTPQKLRNIALNRQLCETNSSDFLSNEKNESDTPVIPVEKCSTYTKHLRTINAMKNMFILKSSKSFDSTVAKKDKSRGKSIHSSSANNSFSDDKKTLSLEEIRCVLGNILIKSDESGYGSDTTRTSSESPCGSIKSQQTNLQNASPIKTVDMESTEPVNNPLTSPLLDDNEMEVIVHEKRDCNSFATTCDDDTDSASEDIDFYLESRKKQCKAKSQIRRTPSSQLKLKNLRNDNSFLRKRNLNAIRKYDQVARTSRFDTSKTGVLGCEPVTNKEYKCVHLQLNDGEDPGLIIMNNDKDGPNSPYVIVNVIPGMAAER